MRTSLILFLLYSCFVTAQSDHRKEIRVNQDTLTRSRLLWNKVVSALEKGDFKLAEARMDTMLVWAKEDNDLKQLAYAAQAKGQMHFYRAEYDSCLYFTRLCQKYFREHDPAQALMANNAISYVHRQTGNLDSALHYLKIAESGLEKVNDSAAFVTTFNDLGMYYYKKGQMDKAVDYHIRQLTYINSSDSIKLFGSYINLTGIYQKLNDYDNAMEYAEKAISISDSPNFPSSHARALSSKANVLIQLKEYDKAIQIAKEAIEYQKKSGLTRNQLSRYTVLAQAYLRNDDLENSKAVLAKIEEPTNEKNLEFKLQYYLVAFELAIREKDKEEAKRLLAICDEITQKLGQKERSYTYKFLRAQYYELIGDSELAFKNLQEYGAAKDSVVSIQNQKIANSLKAQFETAEKEKQIALQKIELQKASNQNKLLVIGSAFLLFLAGVYFYFMRRQQRIKNDLNRTEIISLKKENKIIAMKSLLSGQEEERRRIAQDLHDNIGSLMSTIKMKVLQIQSNIEDVQKIAVVSEVDDMVNKAGNELRRISHNMTPVAMELAGLEGAIEDLEEQLNSQGILTDFKTMTLPTGFDKNKEVVIYRIIQELVQNVAKHSNANNCSLQSKLIGAKFLIEFSDDGDGFEINETDLNSGMGLKGIKNRVEFLDGNLKVSTEGGTRYTIEIPI